MGCWGVFFEKENTHLEPYIPTLYGLKKVLFHFPSLKKSFRIRKQKIKTRNFVKRERRTERKTCSIVTDVTKVREKDVKDVNAINIYKDHNNIKSF